MAKPEKLAPFDDLALIGDYAERFAQDPDEVFWKTSFNTIMYFQTMWKERAEYQERFSYIYNEILKSAEPKPKK